jgi:hypothetical protein
MDNFTFFLYLIVLKGFTDLWLRLCVASVSSQQTEECSAVAKFSFEHQTVILAVACSGGLRTVIVKQNSQVSKAPGQDMTVDQYCVETDSAEC